MFIDTFINTSKGVLAYNAFQALGIIGGYSGEAQNPMPYSKFAASSVAKKGGKSKMIPSRIGMLIIYVPATIVAFVFQCILPLLKKDASTPSVAGWMVLAHFLKRDLEVMLLHKYSGETELNAARLIGLMYALTAFMICLVATPVARTPVEFFVSSGLFVVGSLGNLYHHYLLAQLRASSKSSRKYVAPRGGLFNHVAAPHYMFELIAWLGIALASHQLTGYLNLLSMTMYLTARSQNQNKWNREKFDEKEWPASRKNMIPGIY
jgi:very-long-chain enoyl-CoA reductase